MSFHLIAVIVQYYSNNTRTQNEIALQDKYVLTILHLLNTGPAKKAMSPSLLRQTSLLKSFLEAHPSPDFYS